ncbi:Alkaline ceramidase 3 [Terramyces sp. JEL0728]|nr:Alkaline ceramidase 3 [Terramyces sp. JEL0728]KAJ3271818.1 Alkaline ceramidase 3 [Terramyces sp. JEL0728]
MTFNIHRSEFPNDSANQQGFWGAQTSTLDWCEPNYVVSPYIAEFFNTVTNLNYIFLGLLGTYSAYITKSDLREHNGSIALLVIGAGSWLFHMSLLYSTQLSDELPMIYGTCLCLYNVFNLYDRNIKSSIVLLSLYSIIVTAVYEITRIPVFFQTSYGILAVVYGIVPLIQTFKLSAKHPDEVKMLLRMYTFNVCMYLLAFVLWNIDNNHCDALREWRTTVPWYIGMFSQFHGWWHLLTGLGCYGQVVHCRYMRFLVRGVPVKFVFYGPYPMLLPKEKKE